MIAESFHAKQYFKRVGRAESLRTNEISPSESSARTLKMKSALIRDRQGTSDDVVRRNRN
jgi:hypothetical protein